LQTNLNVKDKPFLKLIKHDKNKKIKNLNKFLRKKNLLKTKTKYFLKFSFNGFLFLTDSTFLNFIKNNNIFLIKKTLFSFSYKNEMQRYILKKYLKNKFIFFSSEKFNLNNDFNYLNSTYASKDNCSKKFNLIENSASIFSFLSNHLLTKN
jgi:hypothetical protein